jgi:DNA-binding NtrC family response regulator
VEDIPLLVQHFIKKFGTSGKDSSSGKSSVPDGSEVPVTVSQEAMRRMMAFAWPGNVRQLENAIERALAMSGARAQIEVSDLPMDLQTIGESSAKPSLDLPADGIDLPALVAQIEKDLIERALTRTDQNKGAAARLLGLKRTTLVEKLKRM